LALAQKFEAETATSCTTDPKGSLSWNSRAEDVEKYAKAFETSGFETLFFCLGLLGEPWLHD